MNGWMKTGIYVADFETTTVSPTQIYQWGLKKVGSPKNEWKWDISGISFLNEIFNLKYNSKIYFHNGAKFDVWFILSLFSTLHTNKIKEFNQVEKIDSSSLPFDFSLVCDKNHAILSLTVISPIKKKNNKYVRITFEDSRRLLLGSIKGWGKSLGIKDLKKLDVEYRTKLFNSKEEVSKEDIQYLHNDILILEKMLQKFNEIIPCHKWGITSAQTSYNNWKEFLYKDAIKKGILEPKKVLTRKDGKKHIKYGLKNKKSTLKIDGFLKYIIPTTWQNEQVSGIKRHEEIYNFMRGGITFINPKYQAKIIENVVSYDINSSYPSVMEKEMLPYGKPFIGDGGSKYPLKLIEVYLKKEINAKYIPFIPTSRGFGARQYNKRIPKGTILFLTNIEYDLMLKNYIIPKDSIHTTVKYSFKARNDLFKEWIKYYKEIKEESARNGDNALKNCVKVIINSNYGKHASKIERESRSISFSKTSETGFKIELEREVLTPKYYLPLGVFITSYARVNLMKLILPNHKNFIYTDTDSAKFLNNDLDFSNVKIDPSLFGAWEKEGHYKYFVGRRAKQYFSIDYKNKKSVAFAGLVRTKETLDLITPTNFLLGITLPNGTRNSRITKGGIVIEDKDKIIKPVWEYKLTEDNEHITKEYILSNTRTNID